MAAVLSQRSVYERWEERRSDGADMTMVQAQWFIMTVSSRIDVLHRVTALKRWSACEEARTKSHWTVKTMIGPAQKTSGVLCLDLSCHYFVGPLHLGFAETVEYIRDVPVCHLYLPRGAHEVW